jgi:hypothetical protein
MIVERMTIHAKMQDKLTMDSIPVATLLKKIRAVRSYVLKHREDVWYVHRREILEKTLPLKDVDRLFFMRRFSVIDDASDMSSVFLLSYAMDALVATSLSVEKELKDLKVGVKDRTWVAITGAALRGGFKDLGLPHTIRKDVDKLSDGDSGSKFLNFYLELLKQVGNAWPWTASALATAISRIKLPEESKPARVNSRSARARK